MGLERYEILENIALSERTLVRRARRHDDQTPVVIKSLTKEYPTAHEIGQLAFEYRILCNLQAPGVIRALALEKTGDQLALVLEDFGGEPLGTAAGRAAVDAFFPVALSVARALGQIHAHRIVHRDLKPGNLLRNRTTGEVKVIDFSIASELAQERQGVDSGGHLEGSLPYMSPEQTGRMNRDADYRSDYYSLGVTFFELLTGTLPFEAADVMGWIHCHLSKLPPSARERNPEVSVSLARIVRKLMAKDPGERYQSAHGLVRDLERCERLHRSGDTTSEFAPGEHDVPERFQVSQKLYGREADAASLLDVFDAASSGSAKLLLVSGYSGVGKSALIQEIHAPIVGRRGKFISGKFDQLERNVPYGALVQALRGLTRQMLAEPEERLAAWRKRLAPAIEPNGQILVDLLPELEQIIGRQPAVPEVSPREAHARLQRVSRDFLRAIAQPDHPLVVFIDDLQWADASTPELLVHLLCDAELKHLLVIGAYRDNEVGSGHLLLSALKELREQRPHALHQLCLSPLAEASVNAIVADTLRCDPATTHPLSRLIFEKTAGNPFFVRELLDMLSRAGAFRFVADQGRWEWDLETIRNAGVRDNVVDLMVQRLQRLPAQTLDCLRLAACVGNQFDLQTLARVTEKPAGSVVAALWEAVRERVLIPLGGTYRLAHDGQSYDDAVLAALAVSYRFQHDRVQQAAYSLLDDAERARAHLAIGRHLKGAKADDARDDGLFEVVNHLNLGRRLVTERREREELARLNRLAGQKARRAAAYAIAASYFEAGLAALAPEEWSADPKLHFACRLDRAECVYLSGQPERAVAFCDELAEAAPDRTAGVSANALKARILDQQGRFLEAIDTIRRGLRLLGVELPGDPDEIHRRIGEGIGQMQGHLAKRSVESLVDLPRMQEEDKIMTMNLLFQLVPPSIQGYPPLFLLAELMMFDLALAHGVTDVSCKNFVDCGIIQGAVLGNYDAAYRLGKAAFELVDRYALAPLESSVQFVFATFIAHWRASYKEGFASFAVAERKGADTGDIAHTAYALTHHAQRTILVGRPLDESHDFCEETALYCKQVRAVGQQVGVDIAQRVLAQLSGTATEPALLDTADGAFTARVLETRNAQWLYSYGSFEVMVQYVLGDYAAAERWVSFTEPYLASGASLFSFPDHHLFQCLLLTRRWEIADDRERSDISAKLAANEAQLKVWAENSPENFGHKHKLACAEIARVQGAPADAVLALYDDAIDKAGGEFLHIRAIVNELQADFWMAKKRRSVAKSFLQEAYYLYELWGAQRKLRQLERLHPWLASTGGQTVQTATHTVVRESAGRSDSLDVMSIIKATQAISSEVRPERLFAKLMATIIENAGAERGVLIVRSEPTGELCVEAATSGGAEARPDRRHVPFEACSDLCLDVVRYVARTSDTVVLDDALHDPQYQKDPYIQNGAVKSVLCLPIVNQGRLVAILYAENNVTTHAFTSHRLQLLRVIASQAAISLTNAQLYDGLEAKVADRTRELAQRERSLQLVLDSTDDGLLTVGLDGAVQAERSRAASTWFGAPQAQPEKIWSLLHGGDARAALVTELAYEQLVGDVLPFDLTKAQMPRRLLVAGRTLEIDWKPVTEDGEMKRVLVTARDITERIEAEKAEQEARELHGLLGSALRDKRGFADGVKDARSLLDVIGSTTDRALGRRALHTLKGNAAMFGLQQLADSCHELEAHLTETDADATPEQVDGLRRQLDASLGRIKDIFGDDFLSLVEVHDRDLDRLLRGLEERDDHATLRALVASWRDESVGTMLRRLAHQAERIAAGLGKELDVTVDDRGVRVPPGHHRTLWGAIVHAIRNAVDHGIETPEERVAAGKSPRGRVVLRASADRRELTLQVQDDGRGVDFESLRRAAEHKGLAVGTPRDLVEAMFVDGVTTKTLATALSGRGVGMSALRQACREVGGSIEVDSSSQTGTLLTFRLPLGTTTRSIPAPASARA